MTLNLEAIKARCEKATAGHTCTETPYGCLRCESETDSLDAECLLLVAEVERLRKAAARAYREVAIAWRKQMDSLPKNGGDSEFREALASAHHEHLIEIGEARSALFSAINAAQGGG